MQKTRLVHRETKLVAENSKHLNKGWQLAKELRNDKMLKAKANTALANIFRKDGIEGPA